MRELYNEDPASHVGPEPWKAPDNRHECREWKICGRRSTPARAADRASAAGVWSADATSRAGIPWCTASRCRRARVRGGAAAPRVCSRPARSGPSKQVVVVDAVAPVHQMRARRPARRRGSFLSESSSVRQQDCHRVVAASLDHEHSRCGRGAAALPDRCLQRRAPWLPLPPDLGCRAKRVGRRSCLEACPPEAGVPVPAPSARQ